MEIKKEIKTFFLELNNIENRHPNLWDTLKAILRDNFIVLKANTKT